MICLTGLAVHQSESYFDAPMVQEPTIADLEEHEELLYASLYNDLKRKRVFHFFPHRKKRTIVIAPENCMLGMSVFFRNEYLSSLVLNEAETFCTLSRLERIAKITCGQLGVTFISMTAYRHVVTESRSIIYYRWTVTF